MLLLDLIVILYAWIATSVFQLISAPFLISRFNKKLIDGGWAIGRTISWLVVGLLIWFLGHLRIPANTNIGLLLIIIIFAGLSLSAFRKHKKTITQFFKQQKALIFIEEILFFFGFIGLSLIRAFNPKILDLEKFMDAGFMASYLRASTLPAPDIWLAGETINYYSFGHFLGSIMTRFWQLDIALSYNLLLGFIMGLSLMLSFSIVVNLLHNSLKPKSKSPLIIGGIIGSLLTVIGGNTHAIWYWFENRSWKDYWYADATRFIETTIHEFPSYSFVVADIHAHVWGLPFVLTFLIFIQIWVQDLIGSPSLVKSIYSKKINLSKIRNKLINLTHTPPAFWLSAAILGIFIGTFIMTSAWDALIYGLFLIILGLLLVISFPQLILSLFASALVVGLTALVIASPWLLNFTSISEGIAFVTERSPIWQLFVLWTNHATLSVITLIILIIISNRIKKNSHQITLLIIAAMTFTAWTMLAVPEIIYVKDIYSGHPRANTMFKLTYQGFILMSLTGGWLAGTSLTKKLLSRPIRFIILIIVLLLTSANLTFPYFSYRDYYGRFDNYQSIDGYQWLNKESPTDYAAIMWMQENIKGQPTILEAVGESYTKFNRVSAITGLPTVLGWRVHEWLWRGGFDIPSARTEDVKTMFENPLSEGPRTLYDKYQVEYIFIGDKEYETYPTLKVHDLKQLGEIVFNQGRTYIIHRTYSHN